MVSAFHLPPVGFGPGSQPEEDDGELAYMALPSGMRTYSAHIPEVGDLASVAPALELLTRIAAACDAAAASGRGEIFDLAGMAPEPRALLAETLGQGEVSMKVQGQPALAVQESVFAGVWQIAGAGVDRIEVAGVPAVAMARAHAARKPAQGQAAPRGPAVVNAPPILTELVDRAAAFRPGTMTHAVNLTLLPHTPEDLMWLDAALGQGAVTILSRGYGNCRVTACALAPVWRVQYFNSMDALILDTFEITTMPEVALAAPEDLTDSAARLREVLEAMR